MILSNYNCYMAGRKLDYTITTNYDPLYSQCIQVLPYLLT